MESSHKKKLCPICFTKSETVFTTTYLDRVLKVHRCYECCFDFVNDNIAPQKGSHKLSSETPQDVLDRYYQNYKADSIVASKSLDKRMPIFEKIYEQDINKVLEIGCGPASAYSWFKNKNISWFGSEVDKNSLIHAKNLDIPVSSINIEDYDSEFDLVYFHQVLEHVMDPIAFLLKVNKALKPGGVVAIGVPNNSGFTAIFRRIFKKKFPLDYGFIQIPYHLRAYGPRALNEVMTKANFKVCKIKKVTHFDPIYGEWYSKKNSFFASMIFKFGAKLGFGTLLYAIGKKTDEH
jgi:2-polyprenyl-3-methyl-5-hydroxy-6-metoxy-1,4-benzoquinol methylase